ncbi:MAG TPA: HXXEE domain-containing protein [Gemmatimonadales bacterium]
MSDRSFRLFLLLAPAVFVAHFLEEAPGFVGWFNDHVTSSITAGLFWQVNITALVITVAIVALNLFQASALALTVGVAWFSFLMGANALFHVVGGLADRSYVPGLITACVLYVPYYSWFMWRVLRSRRVPALVVAVAALLGALPMMVHGYRIVFLGTRLF